MMFDPQRIQLASSSARPNRFLPAVDHMSVSIIVANSAPKTSMEISPTENTRSWAARRSIFPDLRRCERRAACLRSQGAASSARAAGHPASGW